MALTTNTRNYVFGAITDPSAANEVCEVLQERFPVTRTTIADAATVTAAQHLTQVLYQDASGGNVTMTTATAANITAGIPTMRIGDAFPQYVASNHATNTSTISGGTGVTLVGSGAVTQLGGSFLLIKTAAATFDLVRVG